MPIGMNITYNEIYIIISFFFTCHSCLPSINLFLSIVIIIIIISNYSNINILTKITKNI